MSEEKKMQVEVWSDIMCPFCYIGKRKFEQALEIFPFRDNVEVVWRSFQLAPSFKSQPGVDVYTYLANLKGQSREWSVKMHQQLTQSAKEVGLDYHFDKAVMANSFNAHRLIQLAKKQGLGAAVQEYLFRAYFTEGKNVEDIDTLVAIGAEAGLDAAAVRHALETDAFTPEVKADIDMAGQFGISGVPFFALDRKYAVSGAQDASVFSQALQQAYAEWTKNQLPQQLETIEGPACTPDGDCW